MERAAPIEETKSHSETESSVEKAGDPNSQPSTSQTPKEGEVQVAGVARIEALYKVFGGNGAPLWVLYLSIALIAYVYSLDSNTTSSFLPFATSAFSSHSSIGTIEVAAEIIAAVGKPFIAKLADITSRPRAYVFSLFFVSVHSLLLLCSFNPNSC